MAAIEGMIWRVFGSKNHIKVLMFLHKLSRVRNDTTMKELEKRTGISRATLVRIVKDMSKAKIVMIRGATKGQIITILNTPQRKIIWNFIKDFEKSFYSYR